MKKILLFLTIILVISFSTEAKEKPDEINYVQYYDELPDVSSCKPGVLKQSVIDEVLERVNHIRSLHNLKPVSYEMLGQVMSMEGCLNMVASGQGGHIDDPSTPCYTPGGGEARMKANIEYGSFENTPFGSIIGWLVDDHNADQANEYKVGHRRAILNPFLTRFAYGRADGTPKQGGGTFHTACFLYQDYTDGNIADTDLEFVAYPYQYYPPEYVNKSFYLSFNAIASRSNLWQNQGVNYSGTTVSMEDENGNKLNIHSVLNDNEGWGSFPNNLSWKADGLQDEVKYLVTINNVTVNGSSKNYSYWFKLTNINHTQAPKAPTPLTPSNLATGVGLNAPLTWSLTENTSKYHLQFAKDANFSQIVFDRANLPLNNFVATELEYDTEYWWRVKSANDAGESVWSEVFSFTTTSPAPDKPNLAGPVNDLVINTSTPLLYWTSVPGAESYDVQVSRDETFEGFAVRYTASTADTFQLVPVGRLDNETNYWWRVQAVNAAGESKYTDSWKFNTGVPIPAPTLNSPADGVETNLTPTLSWNAVDGAITYNVQLADRVGFDQGFIVNEFSWEGLSYTVPTGLLSDGKTYYWRVKANSASGSSLFSETLSFVAKEGMSVPFVRNPEYFNVYPNPVSNVATISYRLDFASRVHISITDELGKEIMTVLSESKEAGNYQEIINLENTNLFSNGMYFIKLQTDKAIYVNKLMIIK